MPDVDVVVQDPALAGVPEQALRHGLFQVEVRPDPDPVEVVQFRDILALHLAVPRGLVERRQLQFVEQDLLRQLDELVEIQFHPQFLAVVIAAQEPAEGLDPVVPRPAAGAAAGPAAPRALGEVLDLLRKLQGGEVQRGDLGFHLPVDDEFLLLNELVEVLLEILPQMLVVLVLGDPPPMNPHPG